VSRSIPEPSAFGKFREGSFETAKSTGLGPPRCGTFLECQDLD
jgi:hypothetical protein